jgi:hypothetical protein
MKSSSQLRVFFWATGAVLLAETCSSAGAATLCVNPGGTGGCYATIAAAVAAANPGDTIQVGPGKYFEDVVIGQPLSLIGADRSNTIIDATGKIRDGLLPARQACVGAPYVIHEDDLEQPAVRRALANGRAVSPDPRQGLGADFSLTIKRV